MVNLICQSNKKMLTVTNCNKIDQIMVASYVFLFTYILNKWVGA